MSKKYRLTGCAKLFLVLIVLVPAALFIASYVTGDNPLDKISDGITGGSGEPLKVKVEGKESKGESEDQTELSTESLQQIIEIQRDEIKRLKSELEQCQNER